MKALTYAGRTFIFQIDNGVVFRNTYAADGATLHYETLEGPAKGATETVALHTAELGPGQFMIGWTEQSGMSVTHVIDLAALTVRAFWTFQQGASRVAELHTGTIAPDLTVTP